LAWIKFKLNLPVFKNVILQPCEMVSNFVGFTLRSCYN